MNNRAFTLIELTAIIVVLVAIFLVSFPSLINMSKAEEEKKFDNMVDDLCTAGRQYIMNNKSFKESIIVDNVINIEIKDLISYGIVDKSMVNSKTGDSVKDDSLKFTVLSDNYLDCKYIDN